MRGPDGKVVRSRYVLTDETVDIGGRVVAQDERKRIVLLQIDGPLRQVSRVERAVPAGHLVGTDGDVHAPRLPRRHGRRHAPERPRAVHEADDGDRVRQRTRGRPDESRADGHAAAERAARAHGRGVHRSRSRSRRPRCPNDRHERPEPRPARARRALHAVHVPAVRIAFDVSPLSHPRTGVGNYIRGSLAGLVEAAGSEHEVVPFAPTSPQGKKRDPRGAGGHPGRAAAALPPLRPLLAAGLEPRRVAAGRAVPRPVRRAPLLRLDVPAAARRAPLDDGARPRAGALPGVGAGPDEADARREVPERRAHLRRDLRQLGVHRRATWSSCSASRRRRSSSRTRGSTLSVRGRPRRPRPAVRPDGGDARAAQEPRDAPGRAAARGPRARGRRRRRLGSAAGARPPRRDPARLRRRRRARPALPRRRGVRLPVALRGLRDPDRRGDGERRPGRRLRASVDGRGGRRRGRPRRPGRRGGDRRRARGGAPPPRRARPARSRARRALHVGRDRARHAGDVPPMRVGLDVSPLVQTQAGTARYLRGLLAHNEYVQLSWGGTGRPRDGRARRLVVPARAAARGARARRPALPDLPRAGAEPRPAGRDRPRPRRPAPPGDVQPVDAALQPPCRSPGGAGGAPP